MMRISLSEECAVLLASLCMDENSLRVGKYSVSSRVYEIHHLVNFDLPWILALP